MSKMQQIHSVVDPDTVSRSLSTRLHHNTRSLYPFDSSYKTQLAFLIANEYYVHLWPDVQRLYTEGYRTNLKVTTVTRISGEALETSSWGFPQIYK